MNRVWLLAVLLEILLLQAALSNNTRCANRPDGVFINDFTACDAFYTCLRGEAFPGVCPIGFVFNEELQLCDHPWNVKCLICPESDSFEATFEPIDGECTYYSVCVQGIGELRECAQGLQFDPVEKTCDLAENVNCEIPLCPNNVNPNVPISVPNPSDCSRYYICFMGEASERECAPTLLFNPETRLCDLEENVECVSNHWQ